MGDIVTGVGRIVWGNPLVAKQRRDDNNKPKVKGDGTPDMVYSFGFALDKSQFAPVLSVMQQEALGVFPNGQFPADFAWKFVDGDGVDRRGQPYSRRTGYAGNYVLALESNFPIKIVQLVGGAYREMEQGVKTGDYVMLGLNITGHGQKPGVRMSKPGLYLNTRMVRFIGYGEEIVNGPDATEMFGMSEVALPPGCSAIPTATAAPMPGAGMPGVAGMPGMPGVGMPGAGMPGAGMPGAGMPGVGMPGVPGAAGPTLPGIASPGMVPGVPGGQIPGAYGGAQPQPAHDFVNNAMAGLPGMPR